MVVESRSVIRNAKNARRLGRDGGGSRARLIFALLVSTIISESLAQATVGKSPLACERQTFLLAHRR